MNNRFKLFALIFLSVIANISFAAEITFSQQPDSFNCRIEISGEIVSGDAKKFSNLINENLDNFLTTQFVFLNSNGGSVKEAIEIANTIEEAGLVAAVPDGYVCASACALIYMSAPTRMRLGNVLVHRPYFNISGIHANKYEAYSKEQQRAILALRDHLSAKAIPSDLIDKMMSLPSSSSYRISASDDQEIGYMNPMVEEIAISKCNFSNENFVPNFAKNLACLGDQALYPMKGAYLARRFEGEKIAGAISGLKSKEKSGTLLCR